jgi:hypothetical protein
MDLRSEFLTPSYGNIGTAERVDKAEYHPFCKGDDDWGRVAPSTSPQNALCDHLVIAQNRAGIQRVDRATRWSFTLVRAKIF